MAPSDARCLCAPDSTELRNCSTGTKLFQPHLSPVIHEQFGALSCTMSFLFTPTFKTLEKWGNFFAQSNISMAFPSGCLSGSDREPRFARCFPPESTGDVLEVGRERECRAWAPCLGKGPFEESGNSKEGWREPGCNETSSCSNTTATFHLARISEVNHPSEWVPWGHWALAIPETLLISLYSSSILDKCFNLVLC